ncbi:hypothetical protein VC83_06885 [Pseudogymnoascus destructans]|uniref:C2 domain-containing protein n=2 Tax=Pseudogymnoascus destructans TaxID=655981 RepID=L8FYB6_PSED2|nr:uncharacterized protein VC83_06885 [Pseudogymnoascus destructans]ELR06005.1 hypothetical protein GMDG_07716 [Pseudogymnoascus destructans 20631-21]OAF56787.1 hypothetical protein VC83_06885 [Pseudogymnoascus destructans]
MADAVPKPEEPVSNDAPASNDTQQQQEEPNSQNEKSEQEPEAQDGGSHHADQESEAVGKRSKKGKLKDKVDEKKKKAYEMANPPGGYDSTPVPSAPDGYTVKFTFVRAENLPIGDLGTGSSDPCVIATLTSHGIKPRHKEDPEMRLRTRTIQKDTNPVWNQEWIVAGVPSSGFKLKCRLYDEDANDSDDRLGNVTVVVPHISENWEGMRETSFPVKKRMGSWRAYLLKSITTMCGSDGDLSGQLFLSMEVLGKSDKPYGKMYTVGPTGWTKHYSPMIGRLAGTKAPKMEGHEGEKAKVERYDFQANQMQLQGPVPDELYHRFVEFKPFVKGMFDKTGLRGHVLNAALHHQHARVYNYSNTTTHGTMEPKSQEAALQFLKLAHFDEGSRLFTYVLTLDGLLRFTETGKEFGIDMLSKHTMHSDVNVYIACSGEFFIRRLKYKNSSPEDSSQQTHPTDDIEGGPPHSPPPKDPSNYELVIDNDSGTYRPDGSLLPALQSFLEANLPGLNIVTKPCTDDKLQRMKKEQRETKKRQGEQIQVYQGDINGGWSSSDEESMDERAKGKKSKKDRVFDAIEDPEAAIRGFRHGGRPKREEREGEEDRVDYTVEAGEGEAKK